MNIEQSLNYGKKLLRTFPNNNLDVSLLLAHALGTSRLNLLINREQILSDEQLQLFKDYLQKRLQHCPIAKIIGKKEFFSHEFKVNEHVLDPRSDSETLISTALELVKGKNGLKVLDLGTGTGCLLISLLMNLSSDAIGVGVDISEHAISCAKENSHDVDINCYFVISDWCNGLKVEAYDIIISNPPYIPSVDINTLSPDVRGWDPHLALDGGNGGLDCYRAILEQAHEFMHKDSYLILELGINQLPDLVNIMPNQYQIAVVKKDLSGIERCLVLKRS